MSRDLRLSQERYLAALIRIRDLIASGTRLVAADSNTPGDKYNYCSWGLCSNAREAWPDHADHLDPDQFMKHGYTTPKYRQDGQRCPLDGSERTRGHVWGCFHQCRAFQSQLSESDRALVLALYEEQIKVAQADLDSL